MGWILIALVIILASYFSWDYCGPSEITLQPDIIFGLHCLKAKDLLVQGHDTEGYLWATRGMVAYRMREGESRFVRQYHVPTGCSIFWLRNFTIVRRLTLRPECVELLPMSNGEVCVLSAGRMWYRPENGKDFSETLKLPHYGIGTGQGIRNDGLAMLNDGTILFGEYFMNKLRTDVKLYASIDHGRTWKAVHRFKPGQIRHVHAVQQDPYTEKAWICTGDHNIESMVAWTTDGGKSLHPIGQGSQQWRVCQLVFTKEALFWGADTGSVEKAGIYRWDRRTHEIEKLSHVPGEIFYGTMLANDMIVMSSPCLSANNEKDNKTRLWFVINGRAVSSIVCGTRYRRRKYAKLRLQRDQGGTSLYITCLNQKELDDGDLIAISEKELKSAAENTA